MAEAVIILLVVSVALTWSTGYRPARGGRKWRKGPPEFMLVSPEEADWALRFIRWTILAWILTAISMIIYGITAVAAALQ